MTIGKRLMLKGMSVALFAAVALQGAKAEEDGGTELEGEHAQCITGYQYSEIYWHCCYLLSCNNENSPRVSASLWRTDCYDSPAWHFYTHTGDQGGCCY